MLFHIFSALLHCHNTERNENNNGVYTKYDILESYNGSERIAFRDELK